MCHVLKCRYSESPTWDWHIYGFKKIPVYFQIERKIYWINDLFLKCLDFHKRVYFLLLTLNTVPLAVLNIVSVLICQYFKFHYRASSLSYKTAPWNVQSSLMEEFRYEFIIKEGRYRENVIRRRFIGNHFYFTSACHFVYWDFVFKLENKNVDFLQQDT